jgi:hypothetical protein
MDIAGCDRKFMERGTLPFRLEWVAGVPPAELAAVRMTASQHRRDARVPLIGQSANHQIG